MHRLLTTSVNPLILVLHSCTMAPSTMMKAFPPATACLDACMIAELHVGVWLAQYAECRARQAGFGARFSQFASLLQT
jgi:hypothetical protein